MIEDFKKIRLIFRRFLAFLIDSFIMLLFLLFTYDLVKAIPISHEWRIFLIILTYQIYFLLFETIFKKTLGKLLLGLRVTTSSYPLLNLIIRNLTRVLIFLPPFFLLNEIIPLFLTGKTIRDLITNTQVTYLNFDAIEPEGKNINETTITKIVPEFLQMNSANKNVLYEIYQLINKVDRKDRDIFIKKVSTYLKIPSSQKIKESPHEVS